ncbi:MAG: hypothetical protein AAGE96_04325 [Cyanobacteria bacterium P01_G01_bin.19]
MTIKKRRHGCLTAWLIFMILANSVSALIYLLQAEAIRELSPNLPGWSFPVLIGISMFNLVCAIALFRWKKWGFWGFLSSSIAAFILNLSLGLGIGTSLSGLIGILILYGLLNLGDSNKGWSQLE